MTRNKTMKCRSCGAEIMFIKMAKSGKLMPVDVMPITYDVPDFTKGKWTLITPNGKYVKADFAINGKYVGYQSHFATCPAANIHRKDKD